MPKKIKKKRRRCRFLWPLTAIILLLALITGTQIFAHRHPYFTPDYARITLTGLFSQTALSADDYATLFLQTGLGRPAVDALLAQGEAGAKQLLETQDAFFSAPQVSCDSLGLVTREDHQVDGNGAVRYGFPMAPLENGDVLLSFSTHTMGWRHGHAGLVVDAARSATLEAVLMGSDSVVADANHWRTYATFLHLRIKGITPAQQQEIANFASTHLNSIPYRLTSGVFGAEKAQDPAGDLGAQCAYLVWYALFQSGFDADGDGGRIVTVADLLESPLFEVVQVYGIDPRKMDH